MNIIKGKQTKPLKAVVYGPEGIGKSTFASHWPKPLFLDFENGTSRMGVDRVQLSTYAELEQVLGQIARDSGGYRTLVFDTADWLDKIITRTVCDSAGKAGIEDFGYGKGFTYLAEKWGGFLDRLNRFGESTGLHLVFLAHAALRKFEQPDESGTYDRWELKCCKTVSPLLKEWADLLLFANYKTLVVEQDNGKKKATGGRRVLLTTHHPCWDAKNRFGLPEELVFDPAGLPAELSRIIKDNTPEATAPAPAPAQPVVPVDDPEKAELLRQLCTLMELSGITEAELCAEVTRNGVATADMRPAQYNNTTIRRLIAGWEVISNNIDANKQ